MRHLFPTALTLLLLSANPLWAGQFRSFVPIGKPANAPEGSTAIANPVPVDRGEVEQAVGNLLGNWNQADTESLLDKDFYDASRMADAMEEKVPRDARIRLMSVQGTQTLSQSERREKGKTILSSVVSVTANTQMEFNDPVKGFRRLEGQNEYILRIEHEVLEDRP